MAGVGRDEGKRICLKQITRLIALRSSTLFFKEGFPRGTALFEKEGGSNALAFETGDLKNLKTWLSLT